MKKISAIDRSVGHLLTVFLQHGYVEHCRTCTHEFFTFIPQEVKIQASTVSGGGCVYQGKIRQATSSGSHQSSHRRCWTGDSSPNHSVPSHVPRCRMDSR